MSRSEEYHAVFSVLSSIAGLETVSKRLKMVSEVPPAQQPAIFLVKGDESLSQGAAGSVTRYERVYEVFLYAHESDPAKTATEKINPILDALEEAFKSEDGGRNELGGVVHHCWIDGKIELDAGALENQGGAHLTIKTISGK